MTRADPPRPGARWTAFLFGGLFLLGGVLLLALSLPGLLSPVNAVHAGARLVGFSPHDAIAIGPAISLFAFAAMTMLPDTRGAGGGRGRASGAKASAPAAAATWLLGLAFVGIGLSFVAGPISEFAMSRFAAAHGYARCPPPKVWERHAPARWAAPGGACP